MPETDPNDDGSKVADRLSDETQTNRPTAEAKQYMRRAVEQPTDVHEERGRIIESLMPTTRNLRTLRATEALIRAISVASPSGYDSSD